MRSERPHFWRLVAAYANFQYIEAPGFHRPKIGVVVRRISVRSPFIYGFNLDRKYTWPLHKSVYSYVPVGQQVAET